VYKKGEVEEQKSAVFSLTIVRMNKLPDSLLMGQPVNPGLCVVLTRFDSLKKIIKLGIFVSIPLPPFSLLISTGASDVKMDGWILFSLK
jgi:hypothetical protein